MAYDRIMFHALDSDILRRDNHAVDQNQSQFTLRSEKSNRNARGLTHLSTLPTDIVLTPLDGLDVYHEPTEPSAKSESNHTIHDGTCIVSCQRVACVGAGKGERTVSSGDNDDAAMRSNSASDD